MSYEGSVLCWQKHIFYIVDCNYQPKTILLIWRFTEWLWNVTFLGQLLCAKCNRPYCVYRMQSMVPECMKLLWNHATPQCLLSMKNTYLWKSHNTARLNHPFCFQCMTDRVPFNMLWTQYYCLFFSQGQKASRCYTVSEPWVGAENVFCKQNKKQGIIIMVNLWWTLTLLD